MKQFDHTVVFRWLNFWQFEWYLTNDTPVDRNTMLCLCFVWAQVLMQRGQRACPQTDEKNLDWTFTVLVMRFYHHSVTHVWLWCVIGISSMTLLIFVSFLFTYQWQSAAFRWFLKKFCIILVHWVLYNTHSNFNMQSTLRTAEHTCALSVLFFIHQFILKD